VNFASPLDEVSRAESLIRNRLEGLQLPEPITGVQLALEGLVAGHVEQLDLFLEEAKQKNLKMVLDRLGVRRKSISLMKVVWRDPDHLIPERRAYLQDLIQKTFTRALCLPVPLSVVADSRGLPAMVKVQEGWQAIDTLLQAWELDEEWWTTHPIMRSYCRVLLKNGVLLRLFQDLKERDRNNFPF
jgi:hypothetical protein